MSSMLYRQSWRNIRMNDRCDTFTFLLDLCHSPNYMEVDSILVMWDIYSYSPCTFWLKRLPHQASLFCLISTLYSIHKAEGSSLPNLKVQEPKYTHHKSSRLTCSRTHVIDQSRIPWQPTLCAIPKAEGGWLPNLKIKITHYESTCLTWSSISCQLPTELLKQMVFHVQAWRYTNTHHENRNMPHLLTWSSISWQHSTHDICVENSFCDWFKFSTIIARCSQSLTLARENGRALQACIEYSYWKCEKQLTSQFLLKQNVAYITTKSQAISLTYSPGEYIPHVIRQHSNNNNNS